MTAGYLPPAVLGARLTPSGTTLGDLLRKPFHSMFAAKVPHSIKADNNNQTRSAERAIHERSRKRSRNKGGANGLIAEGLTWSGCCQKKNDEHVAEGHHLAAQFLVLSAALPLTEETVYHVSQKLTGSPAESPQPQVNSKNKTITIIIAIYKAVRWPSRLNVRK